MSHEKFQKCIDACNACAVECNHCAMECLEESNVRELRKCIQLNLECAEICSTAASMMARGSSFANDICELCVEICDACALECEKHSHMPHCKTCAQVCRDCAQECREMSNMPVE